MSAVPFYGTMAPFFDTRPLPGAPRNQINWSPLNIGLLESPLPGDFLPLGPTIDADSVALSPAIGKYDTVSWNGLGRATLHGSVDLVTGVPLIQINDLSLPFGGAEFVSIEPVPPTACSPARRTILKSARRWPSPNGGIGSALVG